MTKNYITHYPKPYELIAAAIEYAEEHLDDSTFRHSMRIGVLASGAGDSIGRGVEAMVVGILHDVLEDWDPILLGRKSQIRSWRPSSDVEDMLKEMSNLFGQNIVDTVIVLTRRQGSWFPSGGETYSEYIGRVLESELASVVKCCDIQDHLAEENAATLLPSLRPRYEIALDRLHESLDARWNEVNV